MPKTKFGLTKENDKTIYFVKDNGVGFDMNYEDMLFEVFQTQHPEVYSIGIGLATVKRILQRHSANIWVSSEIDKGATFFFTIN